MAPSMSCCDRMKNVIDFYSSAECSALWPAYTLQMCELNQNERILLLITTSLQTWFGRWLGMALLFFSWGKVKSKLYQFPLPTRAPQPLALVFSLKKKKNHQQNKYSAGIFVQLFSWKSINFDIWGWEGSHVNESSLRLT